MKTEMSKQEARKITIIEELLAGRFTNKQAAVLLDLSVRQVQRMKAEASKNGVMSILHKNRGRKPANALASEVAEAIVSIYQTELSGYNFCHATDVLAEEKGIFVSVSTVSRYLKERGIRSPKAKRRPKKHRSRDAREREGEMAQMDASKFDWLDNGSYLHLHGAIDDATGRILALHFDKEETLEGYCELMC
jgi:transposase